MSNTVGVLLETGTAHPSRALGFIPVCPIGFVLLIFLVLCVCLLVFVLCLVLNVASVSGLSILDYSFCFL